MRPPRDAFERAELVGRGLACRRGGRLVFAGLDCALPAGGALILTGSNGSGKSSLLRLLASLLEPAAGQLLWDGLPVGQDAAAYRARIGYLGHLDAAKPALTARETLQFWAALADAPLPDPDAALEALDRFGLSAAADWPCRWLSAGQRRRLALARLVAAPAAVWLLDEPTTALDSDGEARLSAAIAQHRAEAGRVVIATHQPLALAGAATIALDDYAVSRQEALATLW
ncbi:MAG: heme ABC exporter ATP-binding protein CcmA [Thiohalocapsa sp.]